MQSDRLLEEDRILRCIDECVQIRSYYLCVIVMHYHLKISLSYIESYFESNKCMQ